MVTAFLFAPAGVVIGPTLISNPAFASYTVFSLTFSIFPSGSTNFTPGIGSMSFSLAVIVP